MLLRHAEIFRVLRNTINMEDGYIAAEISRLAGFKTTMMLNYLERAGIFVPEFSREPHHGKKRFYTFRDLVILRAIYQLLEMGARPKRISQAIKTFSRIEYLPKDVDQLLEFSKKSSMFVVNKNNVFYIKGIDEIFDLTKNGQMEMAFVVDIPSTLEKVSKVVKDYHSKRPQGHVRKINVLERISKKHGF